MRAKVEGGKGFKKVGVLNVVESFKLIDGD